MNEGEQRELLMEFEKNRQMLTNVTMQKQQLTMQKEITDSSIEELGKTKEKSVYKAVGNLLVPKTVEEMKKELADKKETIDLRLKTIEKQEETFLKKLNSIRAKLEGASKEEAEDEKPKDKKQKK